jgi:predicted house-cleaning NTP pyrophosphatase (Maf/HAM1 superfamily)|tara:strand:+ start:2878 stop:3327 length:450 start_codon:yes stop_codon:yes gene_type:complete
MFLEGRLVLPSENTRKRKAMAVVKYLGIPNIKSIYRGIDNEVELELDAKDPEKQIAEVSTEKAKQLVSDFPEEFEVLKGSYQNKMVSTVPNQKKQWSGDLKKEVVKRYQEAKPTKETSNNIVKQLSGEYGVNLASIRMVLMAAKVYVKK